MYDYYYVQFGCKEEFYAILVETQKSREEVVKKAMAEAAEIAKDWEGSTSHVVVKDYFNAKVPGEEEIAVEEW